MTKVVSLCFPLNPRDILHQLLARRKLSEHVRASNLITHLEKFNLPCPLSFTRRLRRVTGFALAHSDRNSIERSTPRPSDIRPPIPIVRLNQSRVPGRVSYRFQAGYDTTPRVLNGGRAAGAANRLYGGRGRGREADG